MPTPSTPCSWDIGARRVYQQFIPAPMCEREADTATDVYHFTQVSIENVGVYEWDGVQIGLRRSRLRGKGTGTVQVTHCTFLPDTGAPSYLSIVQVADEAFRVVTWLLHKSQCSIFSTLSIDFNKRYWFYYCIFFGGCKLNFLHLGILIYSAYAIIYIGSRLKGLVNEKNCKKEWWREKMY